MLILLNKRDKFYLLINPKDLHYLFIALYCQIHFRTKTKAKAKKKTEKMKINDEKKKKFIKDIQILDFVAYNSIINS